MMYRGLVDISSKADNSRNFTQCDSLLMGNKCGAHTIPYIKNKNLKSNIEHPRPPPRQRTPGPGAANGAAPTAARRPRCTPFQLGDTTKQPAADLLVAPGVGISRPGERRNGFI